MSNGKPLLSPRTGFDELLVEIHAGEGGQDSVNFTFELSSIYLKYAKRLGLEYDILDSSESRITLWFKGSGVKDAFAEEGGKHTVQRISSTERNGRRHTSIVAVAVLPIQTDAPRLNMQEVSWLATRGSGDGGQAKQKTSSKIICKHIPTGITASADSRSQWQNRETALRILASRVHEYFSAKTTLAYNKWREQQLDGKGRGNKRRTWNYMRQEVVDHVTGKTAPTWAVEKGRVELLK